MSFGTASLFISAAFNSLLNPHGLVACRAQTASDKPLTTCRIVADDEPSSAFDGAR